METVVGLYCKREESIFNKNKNKKRGKGKKRKFFRIHIVRRLCRYPGRKQVPYAAHEEVPAMLEDKVAMFFN